MSRWACLSDDGECGNMRYCRSGGSGRVCNDRRVSIAGKLGENDRNQGGVVTAYETGR